jgi:hypothetical protein
MLNALGSHFLRQTLVFSGLELDRALDVVDLPHSASRRQREDDVHTRGVESLASACTWSVGERRLALAKSLMCGLSENYRCGRLGSLMPVLERTCMQSTVALKTSIDYTPLRIARERPYNTGVQYQDPSAHSFARSCELTTTRSASAPGRSVPLPCVSTRGKNEEGEKEQKNADRSCRRAYRREPAAALDEPPSRYACGPSSR